MNTPSHLNMWPHDHGKRRTPPRSCRPRLEGLEERFVLSGTSSAFFTALTTYRYWIDYAPSYNSPDAPYNSNPTDAQITSDLKTLYTEGWRGLVTYTLLGTYADIPKIAKSVGFQWVVAGVYDPTNMTEVAAASSPNVLPYTDAFVVGNEGLTDNRYTYAQLTAAISTVEQATGKPVTTSEPGGAYYTGSPYAQQLLGLGDWLFPNIDYFLWNGQPSTPQFMWTNVSYVYQYMQQNQTTGGPVVAKEVFYPSAGGPEASDANQIAWYGSEAVPNTVGGKPFYFVWGEAFDQPWKISINAYEPYMGLHLVNNPDGTAQPKPIISQLQADYTGTYAASATPTPTPAPTSTPTPISTPLTTVQDVRLGTIKVSKKQMAKVLVVSFHGALEPATAQNLADYQLLAAGTGKKASELFKKPVAIASAVYNPVADTVTLTLRGPVPSKPLELTIIAATTLDAQGRPIDGNNDGQPGGNFVATGKKGTLIAAGTDDALRVRGRLAPHSNR